MSRKTDWTAIKTEYVTGNISTRELAKKRKVSYAQLAEKCRKEKWTEARKKAQSKTIAKAEQKITDKTAKTIAETVDITAEAKKVLHQIALNMARKIDEAMAGCTLEELARKGLRSRELTGAAKDIEEILHIDGAEETDKGVTVVIEEGQKTFAE